MTKFVIFLQSSTFCIMSPTFSLYTIALFDDQCTVLRLSSDSLRCLSFLFCITTCFSDFVSSNDVIEKFQTLRYCVVTLIVVRCRVLVKWKNLFVSQHFSNPSTTHFKCFPFHAWNTPFIVRDFATRRWQWGILLIFLRMFPKILIIAKIIFFFKLF